MMEIGSAITGAIALAKQVAEAVKAAKDAKVTMAMAELQVKLAEALSASAELMHENRRLKDELEAKKSVLKMVLKDGAYYTAEGDGPFCTCCCDGNGKVVRLSKPPVMSGHILWHCGVCKNMVGH